MIVLDASVLIAYLDGRDAHHERAEALLVSEVDDDLAASTLTLAEVLVAPARTGRLDAVRAAVADLELAELALPPDAAAGLAALRAATGLKMPDCCVVLAAEHHGARLATFDDRLGTVATGRGLVVLSRRRRS